jgi:hypothetical protein
MRNVAPGLVLCAGVGAIVGLGRGRPAADATAPACVQVAAPTAESRAIIRRIAEKEWVIARLIAGSLRLAEAVAAVLDLDRDWPPNPPHNYEWFPGRTPTERVAHALVAAAEFRLPDDGPGRDAVRRRLAAELGELVAAGNRPTSVAAAH